MRYETTLYSEDRGIAILTLSRPEVMNALNTAMRREIIARVIAAPDTARVLVLTGAGRAFCSGQNLSDRADGADFDLGAVLRDEYEPLLKALYDCPIPTIAAVNGPAAGAGASLALACDVAIAAEGASFIQAFTRIGLIPDAGGTWTLPRQIGTARAMGSMLFADKISARQAADWGMIYECVADDAFAAHWQSRARHLANGPTAAYAALKEAMRTSAGNSRAEQLTVEAQLQGRCGTTTDFREGVAAFIEKRPANFTGR